MEKETAPKKTLQELLRSTDADELRFELKPFLVFNKEDTDERVLQKYNIWMRKCFPKYFTSPDAPFHKEIDAMNLAIYRGKLTAFVDIAFRGAAKTARTKLFLAFCICNDQDRTRKYLKVLAEDGTNSTQIVTDIYNMLVSPMVKHIYPEVFKKTNTKREETMGSFTTAAGVKMYAGTVNVEQRGALQEDARPDIIWFEDFENRKTLRSNRVTKNIWDNMEEARTGLAKGGGCIYTCNYISEQGNVHRLVVKKSPTTKVLIIPIQDDAGNSTWERYSKGDIAQMKIDDDDFEGERLCKPSASRDVFFDRESLDKQVAKAPKKEVGGFKIFHEYNPSHRYASGHDVAGGVGLDSSTSVFIDFDTVPARVVATFINNNIKPDTFGDEINREANMYGACLTAPEKNNHGHATIARLKQLETNMYVTHPKDGVKVQAATQAEATREYGWHTNALTKPKMLFAFGKAIEDGLIELNDPDLIAECKSYTRNDLIETEKDPRLTTRHFDLLIAGAIAWQMKDHATLAPDKDEEVPDDDQVLYPDIGI